MQKPNALVRKSIILLLDDLRLRRAALASLLTPWADGIGVSIKLGEVSGSEGAEPPAEGAMILMNIGNTSVSALDSISFCTNLSIELRKFPWLSFPISTTRGRWSPRSRLA